jgi:hypothetical protein
MSLATGFKKCSYFRAADAVEVRAKIAALGPTAASRTTLGQKLSAGFHACR